MDCFACARNDELSEGEMAKTAFDKIKAGLEEAKAYLDGSGEKSGYRIHVPARKK